MGTAQKGQWGKDARNCEFYIGECEHLVLLGHFCRGGAFCNLSGYGL